MNENLQLARFSLVITLIGFLVAVGVILTVGLYTIQSVNAQDNYTYYGTVIKQDGNILIIELDKMDEPPILDGFGLELRPVDLGGNVVTIQTRLLLQLPAAKILTKIQTVNLFFVYL